MRNQLLAISPIDGRYYEKTMDLAAYFSEFALIKYRIIVEIKYFVNSKLSLKATLNAKKIKFTNLEIIKSLIRLRLFPGNVWLKIHIEAYKLWMKKLQIYKVPNQQHVKISKTEKIK